MAVHNMGLIPYSVHGVKRLSPKTEIFAVTSHSELDPYQDDSLYVRLINSSRNGFSSWFTANKQTIVV